MRATYMALTQDVPSAQRIEGALSKRDNAKSQIECVEGHPPSPPFFPTASRRRLRRTCPPSGKGEGVRRSPRPTALGNRGDEGGLAQTMPVELNHTIVNVKSKKESAAFFSEVFGLPPAQPFGHFLVVRTGNGVS